MKKRKPFLYHLHDYFFSHKRNNHRPHLFSLVSVAILVCSVLVFEGAYFVQTKVVFLKTDFLASVLPGVLVSLTNHDRSVIGVPHVTGDAVLNSAAQAAARDMAENGYFSHVSPDGKSPWYWLDQVGYRYSYAGQNLAVNFTDSKDVQTAWMESSTHRANIAKAQYTKVGFGIANGIYEGKETTFVVEFFATPIEEKVVSIKKTPEISSVVLVPILENTSQVLGVETRSEPPSVSEVSWFARFGTSPLKSLMTILIILFTVVAGSFSITLLVHHRSHHPRVLIGGTLLLLLISGAMFLSLDIAGTVQLPTDTQNSIVITPSI